MSVSVIIPVYNSVRYVAQAIKSIIHQDFSDFELLIIDDASEDGTTQVLASFTDPRIRIERNEQHIGNYASRNKGLQKARGKYIAVMDADDIAMPTRFEKQVAYLEAHPDILAVGTDCVFLSNQQRKQVVSHYQEIQIALLDNNCFVHSSLMIRTDALRLLNGYDSCFYYSADYDLVCRLALLGKIENLSEPLMQYRWHREQISVRHREEQKQYADEIRRNYQKAFIERYKKEGQQSVDDAVLGYPDMGRVIALYTYSANVGCPSDEQQADTLLERLFEEVSEEMPVCVHNGLLGIGCGLIYLIRNRFVVGEEDDVLSDIDKALFGALICMKDELTVDWLGWLYYFRFRISYDHPEEWKIYGITFRQHAVYLLDCLMRGLQKGLKWDERLVTELEAYHRMKLCPETTARILSFLRSVKNEHVSFVIPIRVDSIERERNLDIVLEQLTAIENADVYLLEGDRQPLYRLKKDYPNVHYQFVEDTDPVFYRTRYLNRLLQMATGPIVGIWDTDVLIPENQIVEAVRRLQTGKAVMSFPYDGRFYMLTPEDSDLFVKEQNFECMKERIEKRFLAHGPHSVGGAFLVNRRQYLQAGGENEHFYGWGPEDAERVKRMEILGLPVYRAKGPLFHLYHPRKENSWFGSEELELQNRKEFLKVCSMAREELWAYIQTWEWLKDEKGKC